MGRSLRKIQFMGSKVHGSEVQGSKDIEAWQLAKRWLAIAINNHQSTIINPMCYMGRSLRKIQFMGSKVHGSEVQGSKDIEAWQLAKRWLAIAINNHQSTIINPMCYMGRSLR